MNDMGKIAIGIFPEGRPPKKQQVVKPKEVTEPVVALVLKTKAQPKQRPKQSSHNKTIKTEQTLKKGGDKSPSSFQKDFIEQIKDESIKTEDNGK